jgi:hypothetical protein
MVRRRHSLIREWPNLFLTWRAMPSETDGRPSCHICQYPARRPSVKLQRFFGIHWVALMATWWEEVYDCKAHTQ